MNIKVIVVNIQPNPVEIIENVENSTFVEIMQGIVVKHNLPGFKHEMWARRDINQSGWEQITTVMKYDRISEWPYLVKNGTEFKLNICPAQIALKKLMPAPGQMVPETVPITHNETVRKLKERIGLRVLDNMSVVDYLVLYHPNGETLQPDDAPLSKWVFLDNYIVSFDVVGAPRE